MIQQYKFVDRWPELKFLNDKYVSGKAELVVIYGRRRIGKTTLLQEFMKHKNADYFLGRIESSEDTLKRLSKFTGREIRSMEQFVDWVEEKYSRKRGCLIIDEFPFVVENFPSFPSLLQEAWDERLSKTKLMLVLCGSSVSMMEKHALDYKSPLYGRRTGQWKVQRIPISFLKEFFPGYKAEDLLLVYSAFDMIPGYIAKLDPRKRAWANVVENMLSKGGYFYEEVPILLREELRDPSNYLSILSAIASGANTFERIRNETGLDKSLISKYLHVLENLEIACRMVPIPATYKKKLKAKNKRYYLSDNFFHFWLRYVYPNKQALETGRVKEVEKLVKEDLKYYLGEKFEELVRDGLPLLGFPEYHDIGKWWHKDVEIDVVGINRAKKRILLGECKWREKVNAEQTVSALEEKKEKVGLGPEWKTQYAVFARSFKRRSEKAVCMDLKEISRRLWD